MAILVCSCGINTKDKYMSSKLSQFVSEEYVNYYDKQMEDELNIINGKMNKLQIAIASLNNCCNSSDADSIAILKNRITELEKLILGADKFKFVKHVEVYYSFNSHVLNEVGENDIMSWITEMQKAGLINNSSRIKIASYTDSIGDDGYNEKLSKRRSKAVFDFITKQLGATSSILSIEEKVKPLQINSPSLQRRSDIWIE
jgi:outer membrane protein OmpA-like peptidoglycan-associated protein